MYGMQLYQLSLAQEARTMHLKHWLAGLHAIILPSKYAQRHTPCTTRNVTIHTLIDLLSCSGNS